MRSTLGLEEALATRNQRVGAVVVCATLVVASSFALIFGLAPGPEVKPVIPITAAIWTVADLLTAFLLLVQFFVNGRLLFGILATAYAFSGAMTCGFVGAFPGLFRTGALTLGDEQISSVVWFTWHCAFPLLVICASLNDSSLARILSRRRIQMLGWLFAFAPLATAAVIIAGAFAYRNSLPLLIIHGQFQPFYKDALLPCVVALNALACIVLLRGYRRLTPLSLWLAVATFSATLDALMVDLSTARYSLAWDVGKFMTVFSSSIVLVMMLSDISTLYDRLARLARVDELTSLRNRRAYEEHLTLVFHNARRLDKSLALLVVDIDLFKHYNDSFGHLAGDECLRRVARKIRDCAKRPLDLVARYGGEEFVVVLPDTPLAGVRVVAECIRAGVEGLGISADDKAPVTVSIGIGHTESARRVDHATLFAAADRALYEAKAAGRNRISIGDTAPAADEGSPENAAGAQFWETEQRAPELSRPATAQV